MTLPPSRTRALLWSNTTPCVRCEFSTSNGSRSASSSSIRRRFRRRQKSATVPATPTKSRHVEYDIPTTAHSGSPSSPSLDDDPPSSWTSLISAAAAEIASVLAAACKPSRNAPRGFSAPSPPRCSRGQPAVSG